MVVFHIVFVVVELLNGLFVDVFEFFRGKSPQ